MGSIGNLTPEQRLERARRELAVYTDQQRWLAQYNEQSWRVVNKWAQSPARKRGERKAICERQERHRNTYQMIELFQVRLGLYTEEGDHYG